MRAGIVMLTLVWFGCLALALSVGATPALALQRAGSAPELVTGAVSSVQPRIVPETGQIVTDVTVVDSSSGGGSGVSSFTMRGGEVGDLGMWSESYTKLRVGDNVIAGVAELGGNVMTIRAPAISGALPEQSAGVVSGVDAVAAGYIYDGIHWPDSSLPVGYYINASGLPSGSDSAINAAARTWEDDPGSYMDYSYLGPSSAAPGEADGVNVIGTGDLGDTGILALCTTWYIPSTKEIVQFDIAYNTAYFDFATSVNPAAFDVQAIGTHELGHTLNLKDMYDDENSNQVMYGYGGPGDVSSRTLKWGDIAGINAIYPAGAAGGVKPVWRFRNLKTGYYLFTADPFEKLLITGYLQGTWVLEGEAYRVNSATNDSPLWRFRNIRSGYYLYTADRAEKNAIVNKLGDVWQLEGAAYGVSANASGLMVWRFRNRLDGTYLLTSDPSERANIITKLHSTWLSEGPAFYLAQ